MSTCFDVKFGLDLITKIPSEITDDIVSHLTACIQFHKVDEGYSLFLSQLSAKLFANSTLVPCQQLLLYATEHSPADLWFEILILHLQASSDKHLPLLLDILLRYFVNFNRLEQLYQCILDQTNKLSLKTRSQFLIELIRPLANLPTFVANMAKSSSFPRLFAPEVYFRLLLQKIPHKDEFHFLACILMSTVCFLGHGKEIWGFVLQHIARSVDETIFWSKAMCHLPERTLEATITPLFTTASHPHLVAMCLLGCFSEDAQPLLADQLFRLFQRLLFLRTFNTSTVSINLFGSMYEIVLQLEKSKGEALCKKIDKELGLRLLHVWSDKKALQRASSSQRIYLNQSLVAWVASFKTRLSSQKIDDLVECIVADVLTGITAHLSCNLEEQRVLGMAVGEWLIQQFKIGLKVQGSGDDEDNFLKFKFEENSAVKRVKPLFNPPPPYKLADSNPEFEPLDEFFSTENPTVETKKVELDSDDDPDEEDITGGFVPLPKSTKMPSSWPFTSCKPRYLKECLDGLSSSNENSDGGNEIALASFANAEELIYRHRGAPVDEITIAFADALLHTEPPACPFTSEVNISRHNALVALAVVSPVKTARYLTGQFIQPGLALNQRYEVLACLTDAAYVLATDFKNSAIPSPPPAEMDSSKIRRFCKPLVKPAESINKFAPIAGKFFFPLLNAIKRLEERDIGDVYAHLDSSLLSRLIATLGSIYACARTSAQLEKMASGLLMSGVHLLKHSDPAVRRSSLSAIGVVLTITPPNMFIANPQLLMGKDVGLVDALRLAWTGDSDAECQQLASVGLVALRDCIFELSSEIEGLTLVK